MEVKDFEQGHAALEKDIERLAAEVKQRAAAETPEAQKEAVKKTLAEEIGITAPAPSVAPSDVSTEERASSVLPSYLQNAGSEVKLRAEQLVDLAWHKGIKAAVKEAKKGGPLFLDALHDALADKLYEELKKRKLL